MTNSLRYRKAAGFEYEEAVAFYESAKPGLGMQFVHSIDRALSFVRESPLRYPVVLSVVRRIYLCRFPFAIFYRFRFDPAVWHARA